MILPLRRRHRRMFAVLGVLLPLVFIAGVAARKPVPTSVLLSEAPVERQSFSVLEDHSDLFPNTGIRVQILRGEANGVALQLSAPKDFVKADPLVYWLPAETALKGTIPDEAILLGALKVGTPTVVPPATERQPGTLLLYSLANHEIVTSSKNFQIK
jgi:hypothetical protein